MDWSGSRVSAVSAEPHPETGRIGTEEELADRNLTELLAELRVALPGVQVLFAFLLVVPFNPLLFGAVWYAIPLVRRRQQRWTRRRLADEVRRRS